MEKKKVEQKNIKKKKGINVKSYIRDFLIFADKKIIKCTGILIVIAIVLIAAVLASLINTELTTQCESVCKDEMVFVKEYISRLKILLLTGVAGIVPYIYAPVIGFIGYVLSEASTLAYIIKGHGYLVGLGIGIVPLLINIITICITTAAGIYICKTVTVGYRISSITNMNFTNFRIKLYETLGKEDKVQALTKSRDEKIEKLQQRKEKINYLQVLNIAIVVSILQLISTAIQEIIL